MPGTGHDRQYIATENVPASANVAVQAFVPHSLDLPRAPAVVTDAGYGTVIAALAHDIPVLCLPDGADRHGVAARGVARRAGLSLPPDSSSEVLRRALPRLLDEPRFREGAARQAQAIAERNGAEVAADELRAVARTGTAV